MNAAELTGSFFIDTNVIVYTFDTADRKKQAVARAIVSAGLSSGRGVISTQVVQEFLNVALRKFTRPMTGTEARRYMRGVLMPMCRHSPSMDFYERATRLMDAASVSFYDALVLAAAIEAGCSTLVTEDFQNQRLFEGVRVVNPFVR
jgi:predicted nucleic acid-binding protein